MSNLKIIPLGGVDEIGKNMTAYEYEDDIVIIDCGCMFPDPSQVGVSMIIPDFEYLRENISRIRALVITHAHEDHITAIPFFTKEFPSVPIYASKFALEVIRCKLEDSMISMNPNIFKEIDPNSKLELGCFKLEFVHVNHSIPESMGIALHTPVGTVYHSGDFRIDLTPAGSQSPTDLSRLAKLGDKGILALVCESTNAERSGFSPSEKIVGDSLDLLFLKYQYNRIILSTFASNINRIQTVIEVAEKYGRKIAFTGRSMERLVGIAKKDGYISYKDETIIDIYTASEAPPEKVVIVTTGSQGEMMSALQRMSTGEHRDVTLNNKDIVILSSSTIPGNEKMVNKVVNSLAKQNIRVIKSTPAIPLHVSGHAYQEEIRLLYSLLKPKYFIPMHGESVHLLTNAENIAAMGMPKQNIIIPYLGAVIEVNKKKIEITRAVHAGPVLIEGFTTTDISPAVIFERRQMAQNGIVIILVTLNTRTKSIVGEPEIISKGFAYVHDSSEINFNLIRLAKEAVHNNITVTGINWRGIKKQIKDTGLRYISGKAQRTPLVLPIIVSSR